LAHTSSGSSSTSESMVKYSSVGSCKRSIVVFLGCSVSIATFSRADCTYFPANHFRGSPSRCHRPRRRTTSLVAIHGLCRSRTDWIVCRRKISIAQKSTVSVWSRHAKLVCKFEAHWHPRQYLGHFQESFTIEQILEVGIAVSLGVLRHIVALSACLRQSGAARNRKCRA